MLRCSHLIIRHFRVQEPSAERSQNIIACPSIWQRTPLHPEEIFILLLIKFASAGYLWGYPPFFEPYVRSALIYIYHCSEAPSWRRSLLVSLYFHPSVLAVQHPLSLFHSLLLDSLGPRKMPSGTEDNSDLILSKSSIFIPSFIHSFIYFHSNFIPSAMDRQPIVWVRFIFISPRYLS